MRTRIKVCGIMRPEDGRLALDKRRARVVWQLAGGVE